MASFQFYSSAYYDPGTGTVPLGGSGTNATLLEFEEWTGDGSSDGTFQSTDTIIYKVNGVNSSNATYLGDVDISLQGGGTANLPVLQLANGYTVIPVPAGANLADYIFPATLDLNALTGDPYLICFAEGTMIATEAGPVAVEGLRIGDVVLTADGRDVPVKWIGRQTVSTRFGPAERLMPVRFAAGSLGDGLPNADLTVTADHGMLVGGVICHAGALLNGTTITRVPLAEMGETYTVYHVETEAHEVILANGAPAETFIDNVSRRAFDNYSEFEALYGEVPEMQELPYPRAMSPRQVPPFIRARLGLVRAA
ncbi:Hint domain-containing protein [Nioella ostreopsis]|uniref:Hint domain-containing protein n=1 Tax=Nioella ostreopsis TaxID=2448479 RepID=UPI000FD8C131|nr:Hint domain-containing protein [Nioella ostreopsis]